MPPSTQKSGSNSSASSTNSIPPNQLIALPSLACSLSSLPQAKSLDGLSLHPSMLAKRNAESEAKLQKALSKSSASNAAPAAYAAPHRDYSHSPSPVLMMKSAKSRA